MKILVAAAAPWVREQIIGGLSSKDVEVRAVSDGSLVRNSLVNYEPDILIADMQIGNMGGIAVAIDARMEAEEQRCKDVAILLLLDREADRLLAERANVDATMVKPVDIFILTKLVKELYEHLNSEDQTQDNIDELDVFDDEGIPIHIN